jgi:hypothetical protein
MVDFDTRRTSGLTYRRERQVRTIAGVSSGADRRRNVKNPLLMFQVAICIGVVKQWLTHTGVIESSMKFGCGRYMNG